MVESAASIDRAGVRPFSLPTNGIMNAISAHKDELKKLLANLTFANSQSEESDSAAERRWENEGGNPGQLQHLPYDDRKQGATTGPAQGALKTFRYKVNRTCT